jgi:hypothetical protein
MFAIALTLFPLAAAITAAVVIPLLLGRVAWLWWALVHRPR